MSRIFLSYAVEDLKVAEKVIKDLRSAGHDVWFHRDSLLPGARWKAETLAAVEECRFFIILMSRVSETKVGVVQEEIVRALETLNKYPDGRIYLLPVRIEECRPSRLALNDLHVTDLFPVFSRGMAVLLESIEKELARERGVVQECAGQLVPAAFRRAKVYFDRGCHPEAARAFKDLVGEMPDVSEYRYYLVLSSVAQCRPKLLREELVRRAEHHLQFATVDEPHEPKYAALLALIKVDFYELNNLRPAPPLIDELAKAARRITPQAAREITNAIVARGNRIWEWLRLVG